MLVQERMSHRRTVMVNMPNAEARIAAFALAAAGGELPALLSCYLASMALPGLSLPHTIYTISA